MPSGNAITPEEFQGLLPKICDSETAQESETWSPKNPLAGHCLVVSLLAQDLFGGDLIGASLKEHPKFAHMKSHYWNRFPDGTIHDFTEQQFGQEYPRGLRGKMRQRGSVTKYKSVGGRYKLLALRLARIRSGGNHLFDDLFYQLCFWNALDSPCQKMKFGCVIVHKGVVVYQGSNKTIPELCSLCEPKCIRFSITSRTESMLGACGHAEEWGIWELKRGDIPLHECELYIAGFYPDGFPWIKQAPEHTCLRCAVQMNFAQLAKIHVPVVDRWRWLLPKEALETACAYATQEKKV